MLYKELVALLNFFLLSTHSSPVAKHCFLCFSVRVKLVSIQVRFLLTLCPAISSPRSQFRCAELSIFAKAEELHQALGGTSIFPLSSLQHQHHNSTSTTPPHQTRRAAATMSEYIGSRISLVSKSEIRCALPKTPTSTRDGQAADRCPDMRAPSSRSTAKPRQSPCKMCNAMVPRAARAMPTRKSPAPTPSTMALSSVGAMSRI